MNSLSHCFFLVHTFIPLPQAMKIPDGGSSEERMGNTRENAGMAADESQNQQ